MLRLIFFLLLAGPVGVLAGNSADQLRQVAEHASEIRQVWAGFPATFNHAIYSDNGRTLLLSEQSDLAGWELDDQLDGLFVWRSDLPELKPFKRPFFLGLEVSPGLIVDGVGAADKAITTLFHESFHRHQETLQKPQSYSWDGQSIETNWIRFKNAEYNQLRYMLNLDDLSGHKDEVSVYLGLRNHREQLMPVHSVEMERYLEWQEGIATYVGLQVDTLISGRNFNQRLLDYGDWLKNKRSSLNEDFYRYDAYFHGGAITHILSQLVADWQSRLAAGATPYELLLTTAPVAEMSPEAIEIIIGDGSHNAIEQVDSFQPLDSWKHTVTVHHDTESGFSFNTRRMESKANGTLLTQASDVHYSDDALDLSAEVRHLFLSEEKATFKIRLSDGKLKDCQPGKAGSLICGPDLTIKFKGLRLHIKKPVLFSQQGNHWQIKPSE